MNRNQEIDSASKIRSLLATNLDTNITHLDEKTLQCKTLHVPKENSRRYRKEK